MYVFINYNYKVISQWVSNHCYNTLISGMKENFINYLKANTEGTSHVFTDQERKTADDVEDAYSM